uniref:Uncharacterized protein n=1 Tax=Arundo donax TaxID=35708 RepID=A0A0A8XY39_ARUDO
MLTAVITA